MRGEDIVMRGKDTWSASLRVANGKHHQSLEVPGCSFQEHGVSSFDLPAGKHHVHRPVFLRSRPQLPPD